MKIVKTLVNVVIALTAVAGAVYVAATYGDKIVAWAKKVLGCTADVPAEEAPVEEAPAEEAPVEEAPVEEVPAEDVPAEEAPVEEAPAEEAPAADEPVASDDDFAE